jgi:hypothetical protein
VGQRVKKTAALGDEAAVFYKRLRKVGLFMRDKAARDRR